MARKKGVKPTNPDIVYLGSRIDAQSKAISFLGTRIDAQGEATARELAKLTVAQAETKAEIAETKVELKAEIAETNRALGQVVSRLDKVIENTGGHWRDLDARVRRLEQQSPEPESR